MVIFHWVRDIEDILIDTKVRTRFREGSFRLNLKRIKEYRGDFGYVRTCWPAADAIQARS